MMEGSCLCGSIKFQISAESVSASHCHCKMCQKQHGAAFATYANFPRDKIKYICGEEKLSVYNSSADILRKFCKVCGSNIEWGYSEKHPERVGIAVGLFDTDFKIKSIKDLHLESKAKWLA